MQTRLRGRIPEHRDETRDHSLHKEDAASSDCACPGPSDGDVSLGRAESTTV